MFVRLAREPVALCTWLETEKINGRWPVNQITMTRADHITK